MSIVKTFRTLFIASATTALLLGLSVTPASAAPAGVGAILTSGNVTIGVFNTGNLGWPYDGDGPYAYNGSLGFGLHLDGVGDAINPGCLCEGWGVSTASSFGSANMAEDANTPGGNNITATGWDTDAVDTTLLGHGTFAESIVHTGGGTGELEIKQNYHFSASPDLFENTVTLTNLTNSTLTNVQYRRVMDWDIPPSEFSELVTIGGTAPAFLSGVLTASDDDGFQSSSPLNTPSGGNNCPPNVDFTDCGPEDEGAMFNFNFGDLGPHAHRTFQIYYGATYNQSAAVAALVAVGAEVYSLGQADTGGNTGAPGTYIFAFKGVGGQPATTEDFSEVPEPATLVMFGTGLMGLAAAYRRRQRKA